MEKADRALMVISGTFGKFRSLIFTCAKNAGGAESMEDKERTGVAGGAEGSRGRAGGEQGGSRGRGLGQAKPAGFSVWLRDIWESLPCVG